MQIVEVIDNPGGQALLTTEGGYTYKMCMISGSRHSRRVFTWKCTMQSCRARLRTVVVADRHCVVRDVDATPGSGMAEHSHDSSPIRGMFVTLSHASGNVYLPPTLWK